MPKVKVNDITMNYGRVEEFNQKTLEFLQRHSG